MGRHAPAPLELFPGREVAQTRSPKTPSSATTPPSPATWPTNRTSAKNPSIGTKPLAPLKPNPDVLLCRGAACVPQLARAYNFDHGPWLPHVGAGLVIRRNISSKLKNVHLPTRPPRSAIHSHSRSPCRPLRKRHPHRRRHFRSLWSTPRLGHNRRVQHNDPSAHGETDAFRNAGRQRTYSDKIMVTTLAPCWYCSGLVRQFNFETLIVGESQNFAGGLAWLRELGINVIDLNSEECFLLLSDYIKKNPRVWHEDIGEEEAL